MEGNNFKDALASLIEGANGVISSKTVVGDPIEIGEMTLIPLVDVSFGMGAGSYAGAKTGSKSDKLTGGVGGKITPSAVLILQNGNARLVSVKNQDTITKILDMIPETIDKISGKFGKKVTEEELNDILDDAVEIQK